jgi:hypothetical protein
VFQGPGQRGKSEGTKLVDFVVIALHEDYTARTSAGGPQVSRLLKLTD